MPFDNAQSAVRCLLREMHPRSIMVLGDLPEIDWQATLPQESDVAFTRLSADRIETLPAYGLQDLTAIGNILEMLPRQTGESLLAGLRDLYARRVLLRLDMSGQWRHQDVMAFGFSQLAQLNSRDKTIHFYGFDLLTYKTTPDWLNPKYWANPELFDRYRW